MKGDLNCLDPGNVHLNNLNAPVLNVLNDKCQHMVQNLTSDVVRCPRRSGRLWTSEQCHHVLVQVNTRFSKKSVTSTFIGSTFEERSGVLL